VKGAGMSKKIYYLNVIFSTGKLLLTIFIMVAMALILYRSMVYTNNVDIFLPSIFYTAFFTAIALVAIYTGYRLRELSRWYLIVLIFLFLISLLNIMDNASLLYLLFNSICFFMITGIIMSKYLLSKTDK